MGDLKLHIGCSGYPVERKRYQQVLDFVELQDTRRALPKTEKFSRMKMSAPPGFAFGLVAPEALCDPEQLGDLAGDPSGYGALKPSPENIALLLRTLAAARRLDAVVRLHTTPDLGAGPDAFERFRALLAAVDRSDVRIAWESRGVLNDREIIRWAGQLGVIPVVDPFQDQPPPGPVAYVRIHTFMTLTGALSSERYLRLLERIARYEEAYIVFDTPNAFRDACALRRLVSGQPEGDDDESGSGDANGASPGA